MRAVCLPVSAVARDNCILSVRSFFARCLCDSNAASRSPPAILITVCVLALTVPLLLLALPTFFLLSFSFLFFASKYDFVAMLWLVLSRPVSLVPVLMTTAVYECCFVPPFPSLICRATRPRSRCQALPL